VSFRSDLVQDSKRVLDRMKAVLTGGVDGAPRRGAGGEWGLEMGHLLGLLWVLLGG
jgi:hypothetical protein